MFNTRPKPVNPIAPSTKTFDENFINDLNRIGYTTLEKDLTLQTNRSILAEVLNKLNISVYPTHRVEEYKRKKVPKGAGFPRWEEVEVKRYHQPIPISVLEKVVSINRELSKCTFYVDALYDNPDPFLWVYLGDAKYCIAAWDEPTFDG